MLGQKNQISRSIPDHVFAQLFFCPAPKFDSADDQLAEIHLGKKMLGQKNQISRSIPDHVFAQPFFVLLPQSLIVCSIFAKIRGGHVDWLLRSDCRVKGMTHPVASEPIVLLLIHSPKS